MRTLPLGFLALTTAVVLWPSPAEACSCAPVEGQAIEIEVARSTAVFLGTVKTVEDPFDSEARSRGFAGSDTRATFDVHEAFKGGPATHAVITFPARSSCSPRFLPGETWLVYATSLRRGLTTWGICTRTKLLEKAGTDLAFLRRLPAEKPQAIVTGVARRRVFAATGALQLSERFDPVTIVIHGVGRRFEVTTDASGRFSLGIPAGDFEVWIERNGQRIAPKESIRIAPGTARPWTLVID